MKRVLCIACLAVAVVLCGCSAEPKTKYSFAMDTNLTLTFYGDDVSGEIITAISDLENEISWNVDGSAVDKLNKGETVESDSVAEIINSVTPLCNLTNGEYSLFMRPLCALWDVTSEDAEVPDSESIKNALALCKGEAYVDGDSVRLSDSAQLDFGSVGKGLACDRAYQIMKSNDACGVVSVGGSVVACGDKPDGSKWRISVASADDVNTSVGTLSVDSGVFVSTSGSGERYFEENGVRYHHIISAITGYPCRSGLKSVTVVCESGLMSDALSTACFTVGYDLSLELLKAYQAEAVFIFDNGDVVATDGLKDIFKAVEE